MANESYTALDYISDDAARIRARHCRECGLKPGAVFPRRSMRQTEAVECFTCGASWWEEAPNA